VFLEKMQNNILPQNKLVFSWKALDYHPYQRGRTWILIFGLITLSLIGLAAFAFQDWVMTISFLIVFIIYIAVHLKKEDAHDIQVFSDGVMIDSKFFPREHLIGFWFIYDKKAAIINLEIQEKKNVKTISLQMGEHFPDFFRENFAKIDLFELEDRKESVFDLWVRALKI